MSARCSPDRCLAANEPPGLFHLWGTSKIAKSLAGAVGQWVYGRPKVPGEADAFGASWTATAVGLERYAVLRSDLSTCSMKSVRAHRRQFCCSLCIGKRVDEAAGHQDLACGRWRAFGSSASPPANRPSESYLSADVEKLRAGTKVRLVDVPAEVRDDSAFELSARAN